MEIFHGSSAGSNQPKRKFPILEKILDRGILGFGSLGHNRPCRHLSSTIDDCDHDWFDNSLHSSVDLLYLFKACESRGVGPIWKLRDIDSRRWEVGT